MTLADSSRCSRSCTALRDSPTALAKATVDSRALSCSSAISLRSMSSGDFIVSALHRWARPAERRRDRHFAGLRPAHASAHRDRPDHTSTAMTLAFDAHAALIPIDMQQAFDLPASSHPAMEAHGLRLLSAWRDAGLPLIHVRHDSVKPGSVFTPGRP